MADESAAGSDRLETALGLLDWRAGMKVASFMARHREAVLRVVRAKRLHTSVDDRLMVYHMTRTEATELRVECPAHIRLALLEGAQHAAVIDAVWRNRYAGSVDLLRQLIELSPQIGAFADDDDDDDDTTAGNDASNSEGVKQPQRRRLVGWCLRFETGAMGALQVDPLVRRCGLGTVLCAAMARQLGALGMDAFACVLPENGASRRMFERVGFRYAEDVYWVHTEAVNDE